MENEKSNEIRDLILSLGLTDEEKKEKNIQEPENVVKLYMI
jgi:hypothetical protein